MAKKPFINKHGFVEYPFLHDTRKGKNWWFFNLLEDYLKRRARQKFGHGYTRDQMDEDMMQFLPETRPFSKHNLNTKLKIVRIVLQINYYYYKYID